MKFLTLFDGTLQFLKFVCGACTSVIVLMRCQKRGSARYLSTAQGTSSSLLLNTVGSNQGNGKAHFQFYFCQSNVNFKTRCHGGVIYPALFSSNTPPAIQLSATNKSRFKYGGLSQFPCTEEAAAQHSSCIQPVKSPLPPGQ